MCCCTPSSLPLASGRSRMRRDAAWLGLAMGIHAAGAVAQEERCYPGPPIYIQRELLGGNYSPERYRTAILEYIGSKCANGQLLKLISPAGRDEQDRINEEIALAVCAPETLWREPLGSGERALLLFCRISELER